MKVQRYSLIGTLTFQKLTKDLDLNDTQEMTKRISRQTGSALVGIYINGQLIVIDYFWSSDFGTPNSKRLFIGNSREQSNFRGEKRRYSNISSLTGDR